MLYTHESINERIYFEFDQTITWDLFLNLLNNNNT